MSNIVKKGTGAVVNMSMAMLAETIGGLNIMEPPPIPNDQSWLPRKLTKSKIRDLKEMSEMMANIYENNTRALNAKLDGAMAMMTASDRLKLKFREIEHQFKMMEYTEANAQALVIAQQGTAKKISLECRLLEIDIKDAELNFRMKLKEMEGVYDTTAEDGE